MVSELFAVALHHPPAPARASLLAALVLAAAFAGCASRAEDPPHVAAEVLADTRPMDWSKGNWWAYHARVGNESFDVALIVHESRADGFRLGSNLSAGFFGLPFNGNVTRDLNPRIGPEEWPLFAFPLEHGKEWAYTLFGYEAKSVAHAATLAVPGLGARAGFVLEASSFGQTFARYDYVPEVGWFTRLEIIEPTDGSTVLSAHLTSYGPDWKSAYYVEETLSQKRIDYPTIPGTVEVDVPTGFLQVRALLSVETPSGALLAELTDEDGERLARADVLGKGAASQRASARPDGPTTWTLEHKGAGPGLVHLEVSGISATGPLAAPPAPQGEAPDLAALLQRTRPAWPHEGQTTLVAPLASGV